MLGSPFHGLTHADLVCPSVPSRYRDARLSPLDGATPSQVDALAATLALVDQTIAGRPASLVLLGSPGVGKSHLAAAACHAIAAGRMAEWRMEANRANLEHATGRTTEVRRPARPWSEQSAVWVNVPSLLVDVKAEMSLDRGDQDQTTFARSLRSRPGLVVLDDLGRERISEWTGELLYVVVNDRYEAGLPSIATSNLTIEELVASGYWPAISRLAEDGVLVEVKAPDHRLARRVS